MKTLTVVCPVYNEEEVIAAFYAELRTVLDTVAASYRATILFVLDRSTDRTLERLREIAAHDEAVRVLVLSSRFGHQMSLLAGLDHSDSDAVVMLDSDLQHPPALIPTLLEKYAEGYDVVYTVREDAPDIGLLKRGSSKLFYRMINRIADVPINESAADFRLVSRRVVRVFQVGIRERNQFVRGLVGWVGFRSVAVSFRAGRRPAGRSKYSVPRMVRFGIDGVVSFSKRPLQAAGIAGLIIGAAGLLHGVVIVGQFLVNRSFPSGWTTLATLVSVLSGAQLVFLGILGEYVGAVFDEVKARPHYIVDETLNFTGGRIE
jgi:polyisoprenyl-phosphate glycosyltransferase